MSRKYRSRKTYLYARRRKEYFRYVREYKKRQAINRKRGIDMYEEMMNFREYFAFKHSEDYKDVKNYMRTVLQEQQYKFTYSQSVSIKKTAKKYGLSWKNETLWGIRSGQKVNLSEYNELLKEEHPDWTSYDRRDDIRKEFFGYAK